MMLREFFEGDPFQLIREGYHVVNRFVNLPYTLGLWCSDRFSEDSIHYIVMKSPPTPVGRFFMGSNH